MKQLIFTFFVFCGLLQAQTIGGVQLFNPQTNDETPIIGPDEILILRFDDFSNSSKIYQYTLRHYDRNWQEDGLFLTEYAKGSMNTQLSQFQFSFNTLQPYTHYELTFPNDTLKPIISGNFELLVYEDSPEQPIIRKRFCVSENMAQTQIIVNRIEQQENPKNQRVEAKTTGGGQNFISNVPSMTLSIMQNNNWDSTVSGIRPGSVLGNTLLFQSMDMLFQGNNEFYYFDNKNLQTASNMVAGTEQVDGRWNTHLYPVWAYPEHYQYQPDVDGAYYFRRNDMGIERNANTEGDYSWVHFYLDSPKMDANLYILGVFNDYKPSSENQMRYDAEKNRYEAKIYLKQGFYSYILGYQKPGDAVNLGVVNGNFWQTQNLYQTLLYYRPFGRNYDGLISYGELRKIPR